MLNYLQNHRIGVCPIYTVLYSSSNNLNLIVVASQLSIHQSLHYGGKTGPQLWPGCMSVSKVAEEGAERRLDSDPGSLPRIFTVLPGNHSHLLTAVTLGLAWISIWDMKESECKCHLEPWKPHI